MNTSRNVGKDRNLIDRMHEHICVPVFYTSAFLIIVFVVLGATFPETLEQIFTVIQDWILRTFGWFYLLGVVLFLVLCTFFASSSLGKVKLGPDDSKPDFSYVSWFAMLFSAGMGIGLMFFSVAEPMMHYYNPPLGEGGTMEAAKESLRLTFFHWGIHAWAIYAVVGMALAYFGYRYNLPLTIRSALYPIIGERANGPVGHVVDIFAILGTMFGVATSLGFGVVQVNAGLNYLFGLPVGIASQIGLIAVITGFATISVVLGLKGGIKRISDLNLILAAFLLVFVLLAGPTLFLFNSWIQNLGSYFSSLIDMSFNMHAYSSDKAQEWMGDWTLFYWAWWIAWSPFVGMFIARVSRGRTIREFVIGVLFVPVGFSTIWLTVFGNTAIWLDMGIADGALGEAVSGSLATAIFKMLEYLPFSGIASLVAVVLVITFFVTSSDSGSLVIDIIASGGRDDPPVWQRIFWAVSEGCVAAILLAAGGLSALQTASITAALPFSFIMLLVCYGLFRGLRLEKFNVVAMDIPAAPPIRGASVPWQDRLKTIISQPSRNEALRFLKETVVPALNNLAAELEKRGHMDVQVTEGDDYARIAIMHGEERDFTYGIHIREYKKPFFAFGGGVRPGTKEEGESYCHAEVHLREGGQHYDVYGYAEEQIMSDALSQLERHMRFLHRIR